MNLAHSLNSQNSIKLNRLFWILLIIVAILMPVLSQDYGITWDEWVHSYFGKLIMRYFLTFGADKACLTSGGDMADNLTLNLYGHLFDTVATFVYGLKIGSLTKAANEDLHWVGFYETRHALNAIVGFLAMAGAAFLARALGGVRAGLIAFLLIVLSPCFFGHSMNNPKDIPFAAAYIWGIYFLIHFFKEFPKPSTKTIRLLALTIALSISVRIGGILLIGYVVLLSLIYYWVGIKVKKENIQAADLIKKILLVSVMGYFGGLIFWPYGHVNPILNPLNALREMSNYKAMVLNVLFEGRMILSDRLPWYYIPKWMTVTTPFAVLSGFIIFFVAINRMKKYYSIDLLGIVVFSLIFPIVYTVLKKSSLYDGWRHLLFVYPSMIVMAAIGWDFLFRILQKKWHNMACALLLGGLLLEPAYWMIRNHPNEYVYFNPAVGGLEGAYGNYELDYWGNSLRKGSEWLADYVNEHHPDDPVIIWADGTPGQTAYYLKAKLGKRYVPYKPVYGDDGWDYSLGLTRKWRKRDLRSEIFPAQGTLHEVKSENTILSIVVKNHKKNPLREI